MGSCGRTFWSAELRGRLALAETNARHRCTLELAQLLLAARADVAKQDHRGLTAVESARAWSVASSCPGSSVRGSAGLPYTRRNGCLDFWVPERNFCTCRGLF